jgi:transcriptional regulator with XRE-family HTH domain
MADSRFWRRPGRRDEERKKFSELMQKLERFRLREGITKRELARRLNTSEDAIHYWLSGRTIGRKATVDRINAFLSTRLKC